MVPIGTKIWIINDVALGLRYLHVRNPPIIHRDFSLAWPDRYFFYRAFIACSISARFSTGAYTASDKRPVEKIAVWPRETIVTCPVIMFCLQKEWKEKLVT